MIAQSYASAFGRALILVRRRIQKSCQHGYKFSRFLHGWNVTTLIETDQTRTGNSGGVAFAGRDRQKRVLLAPDNQRRNFDLRHLAVQPLRRERRVAENAVHGVAVMLGELVVKDLLQHWFAQPTGV